MSPEELNAAIDRIADAAAATMQAAADGASLCSISRSGAEVPGVKYPEGRWAAMRELSRGLRSATGELPAVAVVEAQRGQWRSELAAAEAAGKQNWAHYWLGGADALDEVVEMLGE